MKNLILLFFSALAWGCCETPKHEISLRPSEYVTTLVGTQSDYSLSTGNTYPAVALPWGMNFWTPQTGIGLSVCMSIVKAHGGSMSARNTDGGTVVSFSLPVPPESETAAE